MRGICLPGGVEQPLSAPVLLRLDVVVGGAGLQDAQEGEPLVLDRLLDQVLEVPDVVGVAPGHERVAGRQREHGGVDGRVDVGER